ncbi:hypothetical protein QKU58_gp122 [Pyramimonas orientalis virus]|uniref:Uncharacterized protein n=1 Tax=Pyramimonas orientalis virus 01B TaxID=3134525 RepID=A0A7L9AXD8_9VIRU|nr:hypothetical protein QKU58_gp122 [Pyramimonas orientalis virus]QOI90209.1 hypothetical protein HWQ62_00072 [Pyramimonas orientalis virus]
MRTTDQANVKKTRTFLEKLGLSYDKVSPGTQKYLLDLSPKSTPDVISGSMIGTKFNAKINNHMSGGRISFPLEYFGTQTNNYVVDPIMQDISTTDISRAGLSQTIQTGGRGMKSSGFLDYSDYKQLKEQYENKFLRKLKLTSVEKRAVIDSVNNDIETAFVNTVKENKYGRLTKTVLNKNLKK